LKEEMILSRPELEDVVVARYFNNIGPGGSNAVAADGTSTGSGGGTFKQIAYVGGGLLATGVAYYVAKQALAKINKKD
jgi:hypothetical protein